MDNNFNNDTNDNKDLYSGFASPSSDNPLDLEFDEPYVQTTTSAAAENLAAVKPKKKRKWVVPTLAGLGVAIVACVCCVLFIPQVNNFFKLNTQDPTSYYQDVEKDSIKESIEEKGEDIKSMTTALSQVTGNLASSSENILSLPTNAAGNAAASSGIKIEINDGFKDFVKAFIDTDGGVNNALTTEIFNAFKSVSVDSLVIANDKQQMSMDLTFTLNETNIISANMTLDLKDYIVYLSVPEITDTVFKVQIPERVINEYKDDLEESMAQLDTIYGKFDNAVKYLDDNNEEFLEFIEKYSIIVVESFEDAELSKNVEVDVNDVTVEYTEIVIKVDEKMANNAGKNVFEALKDDKFAKGFATAIDVSEAQYDKAIADTLKEIEETDTDDEDSNKTIDLYTYVNNKGEVVGRGFGAEGDLITYVTYEKDDEFQFQFTVDANSEKNPADVILRGKSVGEDSKSGDVILEVKTNEYDFNVKCEFKDAECVNKELGLYSGAFTFTTTFPELEPLAFVLDLDATEKSQTITMDLLYNNEKTITLELSAKYEDYKEIKLPDNALEIKEDMTEQDLLPVLRKLDLTKVKDNLKKSLNSETLNSLVDSAFTEYGLDVVDGDITDAELANLFEKLSSSNVKEDVDYEYDEIYKDDDSDALDNISDAYNDAISDLDDYDIKTGDDGDPSKFMDYYINGPQ